MSAPNESSKSVIDYEAVLPDWDGFPIWWLAKRWQVTDQHILNLVESRQIACAVDLRNKGSSRATIRIPRKAVIAFLNTRRDLEAVASANPRPKYRAETVRRPRSVAGAKTRLQDSGRAQV